MSGFANEKRRDEVVLILRSQFLCRRVSDGGICSVLLVVILVYDTLLLRALRGRIFGNYIDLLSSKLCGLYTSCKNCTDLCR